MTPTLFGRWQTRLFLLSTIGVLVTLPFYFGILETGYNPVYLSVLLYVAIFGCGWDILYNYLQKFRWDRDWPGVFQLLTGIWEAVFIASFVKIFGLPSVPQDLSLLSFVLHYSLVWLGVYIGSQTIMRILFPRWRFRGGEIL